MAHLRRCCFTGRVIRLAGFWRRAWSPAVLPLHLLWLRRVLVLLKACRRCTSVIDRSVLRLGRRLRRVSVRWLGYRPAVVWNLAGVEALCWTIDVGWRVAVECWVRARRLLRRWQVVAAKAVLVECL